MKLRLVLAMVVAPLAFASRAQAIELGTEGDVTSVEVHAFVSQGFILTTHNNYLDNDTTHGNYGTFDEYLPSGEGVVRPALVAIQYCVIPGGFYPLPKVLPPPVGLIQPSQFCLSLLDHSIPRADYRNNRGAISIT